MHEMQPKTGILSLPEHYTNVPAVTSKTNELALPEERLTKIEGHLKHVEAMWIEYALQLLKTGKDDFLMVVGLDDNGIPAITTIACCWELKNTYPSPMKRTLDEGL